VVQIFEINPTGYILDNFERVPSNIKLTGLISVLEKTYTYDNPAIQEHTETFNFEEI
jgi:hypothetical protein